MKIDFLSYKRYNRHMSTVFKTIFRITATLIIGGLIFTAPVFAIGEGGAPGGVDAARGSNVPANLANGDSSIVRNIINIMLYAIGVLSVIMLIWGGLRYVISGGQKEAVTAAKNTILYAIVGLLIAIFAYAIIQFVLNAALSSGGSTTNV